MKFIITENRLKELLFNKLDTYPQFQIMQKFPLRRRDNSVFGYEFVNEDGPLGHLYIQYESEPEEPDQVSEREKNTYPTLRLSSKIYYDLLYSYGENQIKYFPEWFEKKFELPVRTFKVPSFSPFD